MTTSFRVLRVSSAVTLGILFGAVHAPHALAMATTGPATATSTPVEYCADREPDGFYDPSDCTFWPVENGGPDDLMDVPTNTIYRKKSTPRVDNCPTDNNHDQKDSDADGVGDICEYVEISVGSNHSCGLRVDGSVGCWGDNTFGQSGAPIFRFSAIAAGRNHTCALLDSSTDGEDGKVLCWGDNRFNQLGAKNDRFVSLHANGDVTCGMTKGGDPKCWGACGTDETCQLVRQPVATQWSAIMPAFNIAASDSDTPEYGLCGIAVAPDSTVTCSGGRPPATAPEGQQFADFEGGDAYACGITLGSRELVCWRRGSPESDAPEPILAPPSGAHALVSVGLDHACAMSADKTQLHCWGSNAFGKSTPPAILTGPYASVSVGDQHSCARKQNGQVMCWGDSSGAPFTTNKITPAAPLYQQISSKDFVACGLTVFGDVHCAHLGRPGYVSPPGKFYSVWVGEGESCGQRWDGKTVCWDGSGFTEELPALLQTSSRLYSIPVNGEYQQQQYLCGIFASSRKVFCRDQGQPTPVDGYSFGPTFKAIGVMGQRTVCGITEDEKFICQEYGNGAQQEIMAGTKFKELSCSTGVCCAHDGADAYCINADGSVTRPDPNKDRHREGTINAGGDSIYVNTDEHGCYDVYHTVGTNAHFTLHLRGCLNPVPPPPATQRMGALAMGAVHGCSVLTSTGSVHCWTDSSEPYGAVSDAPPWYLKFSEVTAGETFSCGLKEDGGAICWGQARPDLGGVRRDYRGKLLPSRPTWRFPIDDVKANMTLLSP